VEAAEAEAALAAARTAELEVACTAAAARGAQLEQELRGAQAEKTQRASEGVQVLEAEAASLARRVAQLERALGEAEGSTPEGSGQPPAASRSRDLAAGGAPEGSGGLPATCSGDLASKAAGANCAEEGGEEGQCGSTRCGLDVSALQQALADSSSEGAGSGAHAPHAGHDAEAAAQAEVTGLARRVAQLEDALREAEAKLVRVCLLSHLKCDISAEQVGLCILGSGTGHLSMSVHKHARGCIVASRRREGG